MPITFQIAILVGVYVIFSGIEKVIQNSQGAK